MNIAILCPGPSLCETYKGRDGYAHVIGVNRAVLAFPCDWWAMQDRDLFVRVELDYRPRAFTTEDMLRYFVAKGSPYATDAVTFESLDHELPSKSRWRVYTIGAALLFAWSLGGKTVDVYGADMTGEADFDGSTHPTNNRREKRWRIENEVLFGNPESNQPGIVKHLNDRGMCINWIRKEVCNGAA